MANNKPREVKEIKPSQAANKIKKTCIYKKALGYVVLVIILALFCILEVTVLIAIFLVFSLLYIVILSTVILYLIYAGLKKSFQNYKDKNYFS